MASSYRVASLALALVALAADTSSPFSVGVSAYLPALATTSTSSRQSNKGHLLYHPSAAAAAAAASSALYISSTARDDDAFSAFADSLEDEESSSSSSSSSSSTTATKTQQQQKTKSTTNRSSSGNSQKKSGGAFATPEEQQSWQAAIDELLDPITPLKRRQTLLAKLAKSNQDIQQSVITALRDRKIDGLLTPNSKKIQDGTRTVARQLANDILPNLAKTAPSAGTDPSTLLPDPNDLSKVGSRILNALSNQVQRNLELLQGDLANPIRIPQRLSRQTEDFVTEARNIFSETPVGLKEPTYTVVKKTETYEIRDYEGYSVASTSMGKGVVLESGEPIDNSNLAETGAAFNTLASYLFGANQQGKSMEMTTPVSTTSWGEMRFYLSNNKNIPDPLDDDSSGSLYESGSVQILDIPPARLAVKKFTGFVTDGEIARQKDALLSALMMDDVELDVAHGDPISHVIFQYNPPYTLPIIRRNEIAVAVRREDDVEDLQKQWGDSEDSNNSNNGSKFDASRNDLSPSDV